MGYRRDVLGLQDARLQSGGQPNRTHGSARLERTDRLDRLVLVLSLALYWAVSTGMWDAMEKKDARREKDAPAQRKNVARGLISCFKRGLRRLQSCLQRSSPRRACGLSGKLMGGKAGQALVSEPIPSSGQPLNYASKSSVS